MDLLSSLTRREREIMAIIFETKEATLTEIQERMKDAPTRPALRSLLVILENKGHLTHFKRGKEFVFQAARQKEGVARTAFGKLLSTFFDGSLQKALTSYLSDPKAKISDAELDELQAFVETARKRQQTKSSSRSQS